MSININSILALAIQNHDNWNDLQAYFTREFKKAQRDEFYTINSFFDLLLNKLHSFENSLTSGYELWRKNHEKGLQKALNNEWEPSGGRYGQYLTDCKNGYTDSYEAYKADLNKRIADNTAMDLEDININNFESDRINIWVKINIHHIKRMQKTIALIMQSDDDRGKNEHKRAVLPIQEKQIKSFEDDLGGIDSIKRMPIIQRAAFIYFLKEKVHGLFPETKAGNIDIASMKAFDKQRYNPRSRNMGNQLNNTQHLKKERAKYIDDFKNKLKKKSRYNP